MKTFLEVNLTNDDEYKRIIENVNKKTHELQEALRELDRFDFGYEITKQNDSLDNRN
ncbi:hypothetical protein VYP57_00165 [Streptococcus agalactiae]|uniref:hypothetical protein n=1 Tax=Streptococcus agalactiae TaxID=1311 RepID=UPI003DA19EED